MFISLDLETTGFNPKKDKIIEFGAVKFDFSGEKERLQFLINPHIQLPEIITYITNITDKDLVDTPSFQEKKSEIEIFLEDLPIIGHNIRFDIDFLKANEIEIKNPYYDTQELAGILLPSLSSYSLEILSEKLNLTHEEKHRALDDAIAAMELFQKLITVFQNLDPQLIEEINELCQKSDWHLKNLLSTLKTTQTSAQNLTSATTSTSVSISKSTPSTISTSFDTSPYIDQISKTILESKNHTLYKLIPPFDELTKNLAKETKNNTTIAIPGKLFQEIYNELPDNIEKLDLPENYISIEKFDQLKTKDHFKNYEITAVLKYLIWLKQSKTGLLREVRLFNEENKIIEQIKKFDENSKELENQNLTICTHDYLIKHPSKKENLIIIDFEKFLNCIYFHTSGYIKLDYLLNTLQTLEELEPENQTVKTLISKSTFLFGLLGSIFEKEKIQDNFSSTCIITDEITNSKEWINVYDLTNNLIEASKELGEINNEKTINLLHIWKNHLTTLDFIIRQKDLQNYLNILEEDMQNNVVFRKIPASIKLPLEQILEKFNTYKLISETTDTKILDLPETINIDNSLQSTENLKIQIVSDLTENKIETLNFFKNYFQKYQESIAIICNSKLQLEFLTLKLQQSGLNILSQLTGSGGKLEEKFLNRKENLILLLTPNGWENFKYPGEIETLFILKIPFEPPSSAKLMAKSLISSDPFNEIQIPEATSKLEKLIGRLLKNSKGKIKKAVILDSRLISKSYGQSFIENLDQISQTEIIKLADLML